MRYRIGRTIVEITDSPVRMAVAVVLSGAVAGTLEYVVQASVRHARTPALVQAVANALIVGLAVSIIMLLILLSTRERRRRVLDDIRKIAELNHHIRNALQVVVDSQYLPQSQEQREAVLASVDRIDKTLRELFPVIGEREGESSLGKSAKLRHVIHMVPNRRR